MSLLTKRMAFVMERPTMPETLTREAIIQTRTALALIIAGSAFCAAFLNAQEPIVRIEGAQFQRTPMGSE